jgi:hypothetical protein
MTPAMMSLKYTSVNSTEKRLNHAHCGCLKFNRVTPLYSLRLAFPPLMHE